MSIEEQIMNKCRCYLTHPNDVDSMFRCDQGPVNSVGITKPVVLLYPHSAPLNLHQRSKPHRLWIELQMFITKLVGPATFGNRCLSIQQIV